MFLARSPIKLGRRLEKESLHVTRVLSPITVLGPFSIALTAKSASLKPLFSCRLLSSFTDGRVCNLSIFLFACAHIVQVLFLFYRLSWAFSQMSRKYAAVFHTLGVGHPVVQEKVGTDRGPVW